MGAATSIEHAAATAGRRDRLTLCRPRRPFHCEPDERLAEVGPKSANPCFPGNGS
jgi:hypothetical protein